MSNQQDRPINIPGTAISALQRGSKIDAIKEVRQECGLDLKDAKDLVEAYLREHPELESRFKSQQTALQKTVFFWIACAVGLALYFLFSRN